MKEEEEERVYRVVMRNTIAYPTQQSTSPSSLKRLLDTWDRSGSTCGPTAWQIYDDDDDDDDDDKYVHLLCLLKVIILAYEMWLS